MLVRVYVYSCTFRSHMAVSVDFFKAVRGKLVATCLWIVNRFIDTRYNTIASITNQLFRIGKRFSSCGFNNKQGVSNCT